MFWVYVDPTMDGIMQGNYEGYANLPAILSIVHDDQEEIEGEVLREFSHGYNDFWKFRRSPSACRVNCSCGNAKPGTE